jgi:cytochrome c551/c552
VACAQGWGNYGIKDGALHRVRFTKGVFPYPIGFESRDNGLLLTFSEPQSAEIADAGRWFAQQWNYRYGPAYGSPEFSVKHPGIEGHDRLEIRSAHRLGDGTRVFIELPQLQPVDQLHLHFDGARRVELFATLHRLGPPFIGYAGYVQIPKTRPAVATPIDLTENLDPQVLMTACTSCHHPTQRVIGPPFSDIRQRYTNNPEGIVKFAMNPENKNFDPKKPDLPPMPSFHFLGEKNLRIIADQILSPSKAP